MSIQSFNTKYYEIRDGLNGRRVEDVKLDGISYKISASSFGGWQPLSRGPEIILPHLVER
jgi:hypothetical protein